MWGDDVAACAARFWLPARFGESPEHGLPARSGSVRHGVSLRGFGRGLVLPVWRAGTNPAMTPPGRRGPENPALANPECSPH